MKISFNLSVQVAIFLVFHNLFVMLFHILMSISDHEFMLDNFLITSSVCFDILSHVERKSFGQFIKASIHDLVFRALVK